MNDKKKLIKSIHTRYFLNHIHPKWVHSWSVHRGRQQSCIYAVQYILVYPFLFARVWIHRFQVLNIKWVSKNTMKKKRRETSFVELQTLKRIKSMNYICRTCPLLALLKLFQEVGLFSELSKAINMFWLAELPN